MQVSERANVRSIEHHHRGCWVLAAHILKPTCPSFSFTANWDNVRQVCDTLVMLPMRYRYRHRKSRRNVLKANWRIGESANRFRNFSITYIFLEMQPLSRLQNGFIVADFFILHFQKYVSRFFFHLYFIFYEMKVNRNSALEMCQLYQLNEKKVKSFSTSLFLSSC